MSIFPAVKPEVKDSGIAPKDFGYGTHSRWKLISALVRKQIGQCRIAKTTWGRRVDVDADNYIEVNTLTHDYNEELEADGLLRLDVNSKLSGDALFNRFATVCRLLSVNNIKYQWDFDTGTSIRVWTQSPKGIKYHRTHDNKYEIWNQDYDFGVGDVGFSYWVDQNDHSKGYKSLLVEEVA